MLPETTPFSPKVYIAYIRPLRNTLVPMFAQSLYDIRHHGSDVYLGISPIHMVAPIQCISQRR